MTIDVIEWDERHAIAVVDGQLVLIETTDYGDEWLCSMHGNRSEAGSHCPHTSALASTPADPQKFSPNPRRSTTHV